MAAVDVGARNNPPAPTDDLDDLFDYDVSADIFEDVDTNTEMPSRLAKAPLGDAGKEKVGGLGIDEEIKVTKKRAPVAKLDEARSGRIRMPVFRNSLIETGCCPRRVSPS